AQWSGVVQLRSRCMIAHRQSALPVLKQSVRKQGRGGQVSTETVRSSGCVSKKLRDDRYALRNSSAEESCNIERRHQSGLRWPKNIGERQCLFAHRGNMKSIYDAMLGRVKTVLLGSALLFPAVNGVAAEQ